MTCSAPVNLMNLHLLDPDDPFAPLNPLIHDPFCTSQS
jgi:hypothetical protein